MKKKLITAALMMAVICSVAVGGLMSGGSARAADFKENAHFARLTLPTEAQYRFKDWKKTTEDYLDYVLDEANVYDEQGTTRKIARFTSAKNVDAYFGETGNLAWSIPPYIGKGDDAMLGEGITVIAAVMSGALVGIDMTNYSRGGERFNLVKSCVEYYQALNGENVVLNGGAGGTAGKTFWYELLPGVLFSVLAEQYPSERSYMYDIVTESARRWYEAVVGLGGASADFYHTAYNFSTQTPYDNGTWAEPDAAAGMAYILYAAHSLNKLDGANTFATDAEIEQFRQGAIWCMDYLERIEFSPFYEVLTFLAPYLAARMNACEGKNYNVAKMLGWTLDGSSEVRGGWGMVTENWGSHYTNGLMGSLTDGGGYAFAMNTFDAMMGFAPTVRYDTRFARDIARWVLCVSRSAQEYYPENYDLTGENKTYGNKTVWHGYTQSGKWIAPDDPAAGFIPYEGLRKNRRYVTYDDSGKRGTAWDNTRSPYASGDAFTFDWGGETDYGLYGASHVGLFGATIFETNVPMILKTDLSALDVFADGDVGFSMYYNPYLTGKRVEITLAAPGNRLYNTITKSFAALTPLAGNTFSVALGADETAVFAELPAGGEVVKTGSTYTYNGIFLAQERGSVDLALFDDAGEAVSAGQSVEGTIYASLTASMPAGAAVDSLTLTCAGVTLYTGKTAPEGRIAVDTTLLRNGAATMTATLTLAGGGVEKSSINLRIMNVVKTPAVSYDSPADMADKWNAATAEWKALYPDSDHNATVTAAGGGIAVTANPGYNFGFATSELFYLDFSRGPMLELNVTDVTAQYAVKVYVDGMKEPTGVYVVEDTNQAGTVELNILEQICKADRSFKREGAHPTSIKIVATGGEGASVRIENFNVYHMYTTPVLDEPEEYQWDFDFPAVWMSLWSPGVGAPELSYTAEGRTVISGGAGRHGIVSPLITADLSQNPVFDLSPAEAAGKWFAGVEFEGDETLYVLADNLAGTDKRSVEVVTAMRRLYPDVKKSGVVGLRIVVGTAEAGSVAFGGVESYYRLAQWGETVTGEKWLDWEKQTGVSALGSLTLDGSRALIKNNDSAAVQTSIAGVRGKFTIDFTRNPEAAVVVRDLGGRTDGKGQWRLTLTPFGSDRTYVLRDFSADTGRAEVRVNLNETLAYALTGQMSVYLNIEVKGGGTVAYVDKVVTDYRRIAPAWGGTYGREIATWERGDNPSFVKVDGAGQVTISEAEPDSTGLISPLLNAEAPYYPVVTADVASVRGGWYFKVYLGDEIFTLTPKAGITAAGKVSFDLRALLSRPVGAGFEAAYEIGGTGEGFEVVIKSVSFEYRLDGATGLTFDEGGNAMTFTLPEGATGYAYTVTNEGGETAASGSGEGNRLDLTPLDLPTGVYNLYLRATGEGFLPSDPVRRAFKQGDVPSVQLPDPSGYALSGTRVTWADVPDVTAFAYTLLDVDRGAVVASGETADPCLDLAAAGLTGFNYKISVKSVGDDAVYLTSGETSYEFYTAVASRFTPKSFTTMTSVNNGAFATYEEGKGVALLQVPNSGNWGNVSSLSFTLDFDRCPVLILDFDASACVGGYYLQINVGGTTYYLTDNTFDFKRVTLDIRGTLASREDGPGEITGKQTVRVLFGATGGDLTDSPVVAIKSARVVELTEGQGTPQLGELAAPVVTMEGLTARWEAVEHADSYVVVVKNEFGALINETVTGTSYDCSALKRAGDYTVEVTAKGENYYDSETAVATFTVAEKSGEEKKAGCAGCGTTAAGAGPAGLIVLLTAGACLLAALRRKPKTRRLR